MGVGVTDPHAEYRVSIDCHHDLCMRRNRRFTLGGQESDDGLPLSQTSKRQFADDERVAEQPVIRDDFFKVCVTTAKMVDPD